MQNLQNLISILKETRSCLAREGNDFSWSSWEDQNHAVSEIDLVIAKLENGTIPDMGILFAPTGPIQEVSLRSGWGDEFLKLADRFDKEYAIVTRES